MIIGGESCSCIPHAIANIRHAQNISKKKKKNPSKSSYLFSAKLHGHRLRRSLSRFVWIVSQIIYFSDPIQWLRISIGFGLYRYGHAQKVLFLSSCLSISCFSLNYFLFIFLILFFTSLCDDGYWIFFMLSPPLLSAITFIWNFSFPSIHSLCWTGGNVILYLSKLISR